MTRIEITSNQNIIVDLRLYLHNKDQNTFQIKYLKLYCCH